MDFLEIEKNKVTIQKNFVKNMQVTPIIYASKPLQDVFLDEHETLQSESSLSQLSYITTLPGIKAVYGLPDLHGGYGFPIGSVAAFGLDGIISPEGVGFDINCGVRCYSTNLTISDFTPEIQEKLANNLFGKIPVGVGSNLYTDTKDECTFGFTLSDLNAILDKGVNYFVEKELCDAKELEVIENNGFMPGDSKLIGQKAKARGLSQICSLGSGNHYLEVQYVDEIYDTEAAEAMEITKKGQIVFMIHTGSRGLGHQVCSDFIAAIKEENDPKLIRRKNKNIKNIDLNNNKCIDPSDAKEVEKYDTKLAYISFKSKVGQNYFKAMSSAANYGFCNRFLLGNTACKSFKEIFSNFEANLIYDVCHNIAKIEKHTIDGITEDFIVHRKGASRSFPPDSEYVPMKYRKHGQPVFIGGSMGTASYILAGMEGSMAKSLGTACHGAGRLVPRSKAHKIFTFEKITEELAADGIIVKCKSTTGIIEEAPGCYKNVDIVVDVCEEENIAKKVVRVKPLIVIKG